MLKFQVQYLENGIWFDAVAMNNDGEFVWLNEARKYAVDFSNENNDCQTRIVQPVFVVVE